MTQVGEAWMPILCSIETQRTSLNSPGDPSVLSRNLGTRKSEMPRLPAGASGVRASTRWTILSVRSCSPKVMNIFCRSEEHTSELQSLMRISYAVFCLKKKIIKHHRTNLAKNTHVVARI